MAWALWRWWSMEIGSSPHKNYVLIYIFANVAPNFRRSRRNIFPQITHSLTFLLKELGADTAGVAGTKRKWINWLQILNVCTCVIGSTGSHLHSFIRYKRKFCGQRRVLRSHSNALAKMVCPAEIQNDEINGIKYDKYNYYIEIKIVSMRANGIIDALLLQ